jgi:hypothetical protein
MDDSAKRRLTFRIRQLMAAIAGVACFLSAAAWTERTGTFWWLGESVDLAVNMYPSLGAAAGAGVLFSLVAAVLDRSIWRVNSLWLLLPAAVPIAIAWFGIAFPYAATAGQSVIEQRRQIVEWLPGLHVPIGLILLGRFRSASRWLIIIGVSMLGDPPMRTRRKTSGPWIVSGRSLQIASRNRRDRPA